MITTTEAGTWVDAGTRSLLAGLDQLSDTDLDRPCALPGWTRRELLAHLASNAEAIGRLLSWARTGVENPMYSSAEQRALDIAAGSRRPDLRAWVRDSARALDLAGDALPAAAWRAAVVTAQGRTVLAEETRWMRAREVCIHAVDLDAGVAFDDLPAGFLAALIDEVTAWRSTRPGPAFVHITPGNRHEVVGEGAMTRVELPAATAAAWLAGRMHGPDLPTLSRWI